MTNEELYLKERVGQENPFRTPEGYFDQLPSQVMAVIKKEKATRRNIFATAAAAVVLLAIASTLFFNFKKDEQENKAQIAIENKAENAEIQEQMIDYYNTELAQMDYYNF